MPATIFNRLLEKILSRIFCTISGFTACLGHALHRLSPTIVRKHSTSVVQNDAMKNNGVGFLNTYDNPACNTAAMNPPRQKT